MRAVEAASVRERDMLERGSGAVPVIAFDALLPHQRLSLTVGDATFSKLLADLGLGGLLCVTSVDQGSGSGPEGPKGPKGPSSPWAGC